MQLFTWKSINGCHALKTIGEGEIRNMSSLLYEYLCFVNTICEYVQLVKRPSLPQNNGTNLLLYGFKMIIYQLDPQHQFFTMILKTFLSLRHTWVCYVVCYCIFYTFCKCYQMGSGMMRKLHNCVSIYGSTSLKK